MQVEPSLTSINHHFSIGQLSTAAGHTYGGRPTPALPQVGWQQKADDGHLDGLLRDTWSSDLWSLWLDENLLHIIERIHMWSLWETRVMRGHG